MRVRLEQWAYENPWLWAAVEGFVFGLIGLALFGLAIGILLAVAAFVALGWSASRGPGRKSLKRRIDRHRSD